MHACFIMLAKNMGGMEQTIVDYAEALGPRGHDITCILAHHAAVGPALKDLAARFPNIRIEYHRNFGQWDILAYYTMRKLLEKIAPDVIVAIGNRAISISRRAHLTIPILACTPNYYLERHLKADGILYQTPDIKNHALNLGYPEERLFHLPNMVRLAAKHKFKPYGSPPVIGTMGRFVKKKGFVDFLHAIHRLRTKDKLDFLVKIGGSGEEERPLKHLALSLGIADCVSFTGWVSDKDTFFDECDIFCLPSLHEPFGIVVLEALAHGKPLVCTDSEGPKQILCHLHDAIMVKKGVSDSIADGLKELLLNQKLAQTLSINGVKTIEKYYTLDVVGEMLETALLQFPKKA